MRQNISSEAEWENLVGYSRAVKIGNIIEVAGTTAVDGNKVIGAYNAYEQTKFILNKIEKALNDAGAEMDDVIRTRMFVTDISKWEEIGKAHNEFFNSIKPVTTMVEIKKLIRPELIVEIEATAVLSS